MFAVLKIVILAMLAVGGSQAAGLPVQKCSLSDKACLKTAVQKMVPIFTAGMPEHGVEVLDPMKMYDMQYDIKGLQFSLTAGTFKGLKDAVIDSFNWDDQKNEFSIAFHIDSQVTGPYTAAGKVGDLPISGNGNMVLNMKNLYIQLTMPFVIENNQVKLSKYSVEFDVKDHADFELSNLYDGDKAQSDKMHNFLNDNWSKITSDFGQPLVDIVARKIQENCARFFEKNSIEEIANV